MRIISKYRLALVILSLVSFGDASAVCITPFLTPTECDFKNEDTHLWGNQPGLYFAKEDRVDELIKQGESFIENYHSAVKTTGDAAIRAMIAPTAAAMTIVEVQQAINTALMLANDPLSLKIIATDVYCTLYWEAVGTVSGIARECPSTPELLTDFVKLQRLDELRRTITEIALNPNLILGEQWSNAIDEVRSVRAKLQSMDTFGRHIPLPDINAFFDERYPSLAALIAAPIEDTQQFRTRVGLLNNSRRNTIREHLLATQQNHTNLMFGDQPELERLAKMSSKAIGRMQATEIDNMLGMQDVQNLQMIVEEIMNSSSLTLQDYADTHAKATREQAFSIKSAEPIPFHEATIGNGYRFVQ